MSDENYNNNEETQALFVSTQKKKQAEEEARKKAEAEQARLDAAEAEVRRMEQEVEERKRKAEEERQALEQAAKDAEEANASQVDKLKAKVNTAVSNVNTDAIKTMAKEKTVGKSKVPLFAAIGAAVVVVILVAVFVLKGKGGKAAEAIDPSTVEFNKEYAVTAEGVDLKFFYPEALFTSVTEEGNAEDMDVYFKSEDESAPRMSVSLTNSGKMGNLGFVSAKTLLGLMEEGIKQATSALEGEGVTITFADEQRTDVTSDNPGKYSYKSTYSVGDQVFGAISTWFEVNESGELYQVICDFHGPAENPDQFVALRDIFEAKNSDNALKVPGENPPKEATTDGKLEVDSIHLGLVVPKDQFKKSEFGTDQFSAWTDENGAMFIVTYKDAGEYTFDDYHADYESFYEYFKQQSETSLNSILPDIESRMYLADLQAPENRGGYFAEYRDVIGGINYWEGYCSGMWRDVRTDEYSFYSIILMAPEKNKDIYKQIYNTAVDRVEDI